MSEKTEAAPRRVRRDSPTVDAVCRELHAIVDAAEATTAVEFAEIFLGKAPADLLAVRSPADLARMVLGAFRFLQESSPSRVNVRVFNPDLGAEGWRAPVTVVRTCVSERPFIVDTIREYIHGEGIDIEHMVYPVLSVRRDEGGRLLAVARAAAGGTRQSLVHCEVSQVTDPETLAALEREVGRRLQDVVRATDDFPAMVDAIDAVVTELAERAQALPDRRDEITEIQDFLRWLRDGGFVLLGRRSYDIVAGPDGEKIVIVEPGSGLGVLRNEAESRFAGGVPLSELEEGIHELLMHGPILIINKTNAEATVHRRSRMDYIGVKKLAPDGSVAGEHRLVGLFTSKAYAEDAESIPILRRKLSQILADAGVEKGTHDYKEIITIFNSLPKGQLFLASAEEVGADVHTVLTSYHTSDVRVTLREDVLNRGVSVMVILPRERFSGAVREEIEASLLETFRGETLSYHLAMGGGEQARLHFYLSADPERVAGIDAKNVEVDVERLIRSWGDRLREALEQVRPPDDARRLARFYDAALSAEYQASTEPDLAVDDVLALEAMRAEGRDVAVSFSNRARAVASPGVPEVTELRVYLRGEALILSDFMPILENAGLRVIEVNPFEGGFEAGVATTVYVFAVQDRQGRQLDVTVRAPLLAETILAVRAGDAVNDSLNALVLLAGLRWREVDVLRGYTGYAFQIGAVPSRLSLPTALVEHPGIARQLFELFATLFSPPSGASTEDRPGAAAALRAAFHESLRGVESLADDRVVRRLEQLIGATVRTNYYRQGGADPTFRSGGVPYISFKFACREMEFLRRTRLLYEVWVHSARMEGVHLRGAKVARGGIRWSDRPDDFRTEILGLVKTQMVKNAVIVPAGSKGGFVLKRPPRDPGARFAEAKEQYRTLIRGLLDVTDNLDAQGRTVAPPDVVAFDDPDPYLVVAADKGTATFSDVANAISVEYGFWMGDAFASGGSNGYDHKEVGITARGAWECVKRHFRERGKDIQSEPFDVVGIGDMSGDVFGNGMLLSEQIRLLAAFDHRHVFIDPDPDPAASYAERKRLFGLDASTWDDYDRSALSEGGVIVPRGAKEVELSPQVRAALGLADDTATLDGEALIRAVLRAPAELLWNGGIGTYVKAEDETHSEAGDPANDAVRVSATELRCNVVGEGGNLGFTQAARIEYALAGGRLNTDAIDNSGGVDMSDHEVNLKILLASAVADGTITEARRNALLEELTEDVAELVLEDNRSQSLAVSLDELRATEVVSDFRELMFSLEKSGELDRTAEGLPSVDVLVERRDHGHSLVRPELCVLLAYAKLMLMSRLLRSSLPDDPVTESYLVGYFPGRAIDGSGERRLGAHRLRREIIASQLTNDLVDLMGATFVDRLMRDTGRGAEEIVRGWLVASRLADHRGLLAEMARQESVMNVRVSYRWLLGLARVLERTTRWVLRNVDADESPASVVERSLDGLASLREAFAEVVAGEERSVFEARVREMAETGADQAFSRRLITLRFLDQLLDVMDIARGIGADATETARVYYRVSEAFEVPWLRRVAFGAAGAGQWEQRAARMQSEDLARAHRKLVVAVMAPAGGEDREQARVDAFLRARGQDVQRFQAIVAELKGEEAPGLAAVSVAVRELATVADRAE